MGILANENAISSGGYQISNSLRFQSASSQYATKWVSASTSKITFSMWIKRGTLGTEQWLNSFWNGVVGASGIRISLNTDNTLTYTQDTWTGASGYTASATTPAVFRDPSAWYHLVVSVDYTQASFASAIKLYINGVQQTLTVSISGGSYSSLTVPFNYQTLGARYYNGSYSTYFDGYMAEVNWIDGQALTPSSFGETNALTGQWVAKKYTGTYGTNGFYLPFTNGTSTTTLGADGSGNSNNWTLTNFTRSAGVSDCWMNDVPSGNGSQAGGTQPNSNYCIANPLQKGTQPTVSNSNLTVTQNNAGSSQVLGSIAPKSGKWYWEQAITSNFASQGWIGLATQATNLNQTCGLNATSWAYNPYPSFTYVVTNGSYTAVTSDANTGVYGVAYDADAGKVWFRRSDGAWVSGDPAAGTSPSFTGVPSECAPSIGYNSGGSSFCTQHLNAGQRSFAYTPPSGFKALCAANLPASTIVKGNQYMDATLYTGTNANLTVTNAGAFAVDMLWLKVRSTTAGFNQNDSIRGPHAVLTSAGTNAESTSTSTTGVTAFNSNGFSLGTETSSVGSTNLSGQTYVAYQWKAGAGTTSSNTSGSITSTVSVNTTAGVSVVTYTGTGATATVGHGLGVAPKMVIVKNRTDGTTNWAVYHVSTGANAVLFLNSTAASTTVSGKWGTPSSTTFGVNAADDVNKSSSNLVAYCFAEIAGFSKFGSYTGNSSADGPFVYTGFRPKYVMIKRSDSPNNWITVDTSRSTYNLATAQLSPNSGAAEVTGPDFNPDILSNGFKLRTTLDASNGSGGTYIYMAFAENPFAQANAR